MVDNNFYQDANRQAKVKMPQVLQDVTADPESWATITGEGTCRNSGASRGKK
jgi:hypothetical protein